MDPRTKEHIRIRRYFFTPELILFTTGSFRCSKFARLNSRTSLKIGGRIPVNLNIFLKSIFAPQSVFSPVTVGLHQERHPG